MNKRILALFLLLAARIVSAQGFFVDEAAFNDSPVEHEALGNPSSAQASAGFSNDYLIERDQYVLSYHRDRGTPNWVEWHLDSSWLGSADRQDDYRADTSLPMEWYQVQPTDFFGTGFDRGHMCPSADRTSSVADNSATFWMTNMIPQAPNNNRGPWAALESYCRTLVSEGNELYIYAGPSGQGGSGSTGGTTNTLASGHVTVPSVTWKVILVLPVGSSDAARVAKTTRTIAVMMPNAQSIGSTTAWRNFRVSVRKVEQLTALNFFSNVRPNVRRFLKVTTDSR